VQDESRDMFQRVLTGLRASWRPLLLVHVIATLAGIAVLTPLTAALVRALVALSGDAVVADQQILDFLLTPAGLIALVLIAAILLTITALELAAMMAIGFAELQGWQLSAWQAIAYSARRAIAVLLLAVRVVARALLLAAPFLAIAAGLYRWLLTDYDINYYLMERPPEFWITAVLIGLLPLALGVVLLRRLSAWAICLPLLLFQMLDPPQALAASAGHTQDRRMRVCRYWIAWSVAALLLQSATLVVLDGIGGLLVPATSTSLARVLSALSMLLVIAMVAGMLVAATQAATCALLTLAMFDRWIPQMRDVVPELGAAVRTEPVPRSVRFVAGWSLAAAALLAVLAGYWLMNSVQPDDDVEVVAHRGAAGRAPENTLASVQAALEDGADWIEIDVQETADGEVVVVHDSDFMKLAGVDLQIWRGSLATIRAIDVGGWFGQQFAGERVPTLAEVLAAAKGRAGVVIELKYYGHDQQLEQRVAGIVEAAGMQDQVAIMSLDRRGLRKFRALGPDWTVGLLMARAAGRVAALDVDFLAVNSGMADRRLIESAHAAGKKVYVWTINDPAAMSSMISLGVDALITDEPALARRVIEQRASMNVAERLLVRMADRFDWLRTPTGYRDQSP